jgi:hypothetical protein
MRGGAKLLSRGLRDANGALTLIGALLVLRSIVKWLDGPAEELVYTRTLRRGESVRVGLTEPES